MTLKQKIWKVAKYFAKYLPVYSGLAYLNKFTKGKTDWDEYKPIRLIGHGLYGALTAVDLLIYTLNSAGYKSLNPIEHIKPHRQAIRESKYGNNLRSKLYSYIDKNGDKRYMLSELTEFCEKVDVNSNNFEVGTYLLSTHIDNLDVNDLEKAVQAYEVEQNKSENY